MDGQQFNTKTEFYTIVIFFRRHNTVQTVFSKLFNTLIKTLCDEWSNTNLIQKLCLLLWYIFYEMQYNRIDITHWLLIYASLFQTFFFNYVYSFSFTKNLNKKFVSIAKNKRRHRSIISFYSFLIILSKYQEWMFDNLIPKLNSKL